MRQNDVENPFFKFEEDFVEAKIRCIPMIVRFKLDACGIKLKLAEWSRMSAEERGYLAMADIETPPALAQYKKDLCRLIFDRTGNSATEIPVPENPAWSRKVEVPYTVSEKLKEISPEVSLEQWQGLTDLQRFALLKLSYPGHENKNFPRALVEFGLMVA
jgi:hypothetical protein